MFKTWWIVPVLALSAGCAKNVATNPHDTGGGGVSLYENHSVKKPGAAGTGSSAASQGPGAVAGSGAPDATGNQASATDSNGGQGKHGNPNALL